MEKKIVLLLHNLGIKATYRGYYYLLYALPVCIEDENYLLHRGKLLYPDVAKQFRTNKDNIEHCIRTVIDACWKKGNREFLKEMAGYPLKCSPSVGDFFDILIHYLKFNA